MDIFKYVENVLWIELERFRSAPLSVQDAGSISGRQRESHNRIAVVFVSLYRPIAAALSSRHPDETIYCAHCPQSLLQIVARESTNFLSVQLFHAELYEYLLRFFPQYKS